MPIRLYDRSSTDHIIRFNFKLAPKVVEHWRGFFIYMNYIYPDQEQHRNEYLKRYGENFLQLNSLSVGDIVKIEFPYEGLSSNYKSNQQSRYRYNTVVEGVLKLDENGILFAESLIELQFYETKYKGNSLNSYYHPVKKKSIVYFGTGVIYKL